MTYTAVGTAVGTTMNVVVLYVLGFRLYVEP